MNTRPQLPTALPERLAVCLASLIILVLGSAVLLVCLPISLFQTLRYHFTKGSS